MESRRQRMVDRMMADFEAPYQAGAMPDAEHRVANALEYIAFQLGRIRRRLEELDRAPP
jgi:hypothetical protein